MLPAPPQPLTIAIIGGGVGGLALAIGLLHHTHIRVRIYDAASAFEQIGAGVTIGPNARRALHLLDPGAERAFLTQATGNGPDFPELRNVFCRFVFGAGPRSGELIGDAWCEDGQQSVHRAKFLDELFALIPKGTIQFSKRLSKDGIERVEGSGRVKVRFEDGTTDEVDCVVGADGVHSVVRRHILPSRQPGVDPAFACAAAYRGLIPIEEARAVLGDETTQVATLHAGPGACIMTYPVDFHRLFNIVACDVDVDFWDGPTVQIADREKMKARFGEWGATARKIVDLLDRPETKVWSLWQIPTKETFVKGPVVIMGDAAHAMVPFHGQGAGQAIEDALVLSNLLGKVVVRADLEFALKAYDRIRRPRSQRVVRSSREAGELFGLRLEGVLDDVHAFRANVEDRYDSTFNRDMQLQVDQAVIMMEEIRVTELKNKATGP